MVEIITKLKERVYIQLTLTESGSLIRIAVKTSRSYNE